MLRIVTYNVHHCRGTDGVVSTERISRVLAQCGGDIIALQEVDCGQARTHHEDQAQSIAEQLAMAVRFQPAIGSDTQGYGNAILSRHPMHMVRSECYPYCGSGEPRAAIWVEIRLDGKTLQVISTHLGYMPGQQQQQLEALLGWIADPGFRGPRIVCGDLNSWAGTRTYGRLRALLRDAQDGNFMHRPRPTFPSRLPLVRIDHVFHSPDIRIENVRVPRTSLTRLASDHLPLVVDAVLV